MSYQMGVPMGPRRQSAAFRMPEVGERQPVIIPQVKKTHKHPRSGHVCLYIRGRLIHRRAYTYKQQRTNIIAFWREEYQGDIEIRIEPQLFES